MEADYGTNPTHEPTENSGRGHGDQRRAYGGKRNESNARGRATTTHPAKHGKSRTSGPLDPLRETACSNPLRDNRGTIHKHCRACRINQTRWAFLV
jgi:hypothetical protein